LKQVNFLARRCAFLLCALNPHSLHLSLASLSE
jgi:hypothetical protein